MFKLILTEKCANRFMILNRTDNVWSADIIATANCHTKQKRTEKIKHPKDELLSINKNMHHCIEQIIFANCNVCYELVRLSTKK